MNQALLNDLCSAINRNSRENASNTPDYVLASYLYQCLENYEAAVNARERWYGREAPVPANVNAAPIPVAPALPR